MLKLWAACIQILIASFINLAETGKGREGVSLSIARVTTAAGVGHEQRPQTGGWSKYLIVEGHIASQKLKIFRFSQALHRAIQEFMIFGGLGLEFFACPKH